MREIKRWGKRGVRNSKCVLSSGVVGHCCFNVMPRRKPQIQLSALFPTIKTLISLPSIIIYIYDNHKTCTTHVITIDTVNGRESTSIFVASSFGPLRVNPLFTFNYTANYDGVNGWYYQIGVIKYNFLD